MSRQATCPSCRCVLRVPASTRDRWLTCPRCLASVVNPNLQVQDGPPPPPERTAAGTEPCAWCGEQVEKSWRVCPFCEAPRGRFRGELGVPAADLDVRRDSKGTGLGLGILAAYAVLGLILLLTLGGSLAKGSKAGEQILSTGLGVVVVIGLGCAALVVTVRGKTGKTVPTVLGASVIGIVVTVVLALLVLSCVLNFIFTCGGLVK